MLFIIKNTSCAEAQEAGQTTRGSTLIFYSIIYSLPGAPSHFDTVRACSL